MKSPPFDPTFFERDPRFWPIAPAASAFVSFASWPPVAEYNARLVFSPGVVFREHVPRTRGKRRAAVGPRDLYDGRIIEEGWVPTRAGNWHDYLNMLVWATFPEAKKELHLRQHHAQVKRLETKVFALPNARTREQDALALLDEGGAVVLCREGAKDDLHAALTSRRSDVVKALFADGHAFGLVFGHAVYEGLVKGDPEGWVAVCLSAWDGAVDPASLVRAADISLASALTAEGSFLSPDTLVRLDLPLLREPARDALGEATIRP